MSVETGLKSKLIDLLDIEVHYGKSIGGSKTSYCTYARQGSESDPLNGGEAGLIQDTFLVELYALTRDSVIAYADSVRTLNGYTGLLGAYRVMGVIISDQQESVIERDGDGDTELFVSQITMTIYH